MNSVAIKGFDDGVVGYLHMVFNHYRACNATVTLYDNVLVEQNRTTTHNGVTTNQNMML